MSAIVLAVGNAEVLFAPESTPIKDNDDDIVRFVDPNSACVSAFDLSVLRGDGIFEATTVWQGFPISWENHMHRLANSARLMDMPVPNQAALTAAARQIITAYDDPEPGPLLRVLVSRGVDPTTGIGAENADVQHPNVWMFLDGRGTLHDTKPIHAPRVRPAWRG